MNTVLQKQLYQKYPKIFRQKNLSMRETCMCWGIECGDGWYDLLDNLCSELQFNTDNNDYPQVEATQVKEKYGTLRFYYISIAKNKEDKYLERKEGAIDGITSFAESLSSTICEKCGNKGEIDDNASWLRCRCERCQ